MESVAEENLAVSILHIDENRMAITGGQRSRRSSGYASASSSPSAVKRALELQAAAASIPLSTARQTDEASDDWRLSSLYEVTLRWMFDADDVSHSAAAVLDDSGSAEEIDGGAATSVVASDDFPAEIIRIYLHFFCHQKNKLPSFVDFRPIPHDDDRNGSDDVRHLYSLVFQDGSAAPHTSFPM